MLKYLHTLTTIVLKVQDTITTTTATAAETIKTA